MPGSYSLNFGLKRDTNLQAGVDLEPDGPSESLANISFVDCVSKHNAGNQFSLWLANLDNSSEPVSILFKNCSVEGSALVGESGFYIAGAHRGLKGSVNVVDTRVRNTRMPGAYLGDLISPKTFTVRFHNTSFDQVARMQPWQAAHPLSILLGSNHAFQNAQNMGGVEFVNVTVVDACARPFMLIDSPKIAAVNISFSGVVHVTKLAFCQPDVMASETLGLSMYPTCVATTAPDKSCQSSIKNDDNDEAANNTVRHFSWFHNDVDVTSAFSTFVFDGFTTAAAVLENHKRYGLQTMWNLEGNVTQPGGSPLWTMTAPACRPGCLNNATHCPSPLCVMALRSDWRTQWEAIAVQAEPLLRNGLLMGFWLGDELYHQGVLPSELAMVADAVRSRFPTAITWTNLCTPYPGYSPPAEALIPSSLSWVSMDIYAPTPTVQKIYAATLFPHLRTNQSVVLVPGSFATRHYPLQCADNDATCYAHDLGFGDAKSAKIAGEMEAWAAADKRVAAIVPWNWLGCTGCNTTKDEVGTVGLPRAVAAWKAIGEGIKKPPLKADDERPGGTSRAIASR